MFEVFPSMKSEFAEISLPRLSQMLTQPKPHPLAQHFDTALQSFFEKEAEVNEESLSEPFKIIYEYQFQRAEFYELLIRSLIKILKRELKKIEELISLHSRKSDQQEFNRIKLDKILKQCFSRIDESAQCIHEFIVDIEEENQWECNCGRDVCDQRQSSEQFIQDIFGFLLRTSQPINREILDGVRRNIVFHLFFTNAQQLCKKEWALGNRSGELILQIESSCQKLKKAKKRKRNKKSKEKPAQLANNQIEGAPDQDYEALLNLVTNLEIQDQKRQPCIVTEQWLQKIAARNQLLKK